jgi:long-chain acyl-CoA synthetase
LTPAGTIAIGTRQIAQDVFHRISMCVARGLHELGIAEGDSVGVLMRNDFAVIQTYLATTALGAFAIPYNWHSKPEEISYLLGDSRPKVLVAHSDLLRLAQSVIPEGLPVVVVPTPPEAKGHYRIPEYLCSAAPGELDWTSWSEKWAPWTETARLTRGTIVYTSGTTGYPKGVRREPMSPDLSSRFGKLTGMLFGRGEHMRAYVGGPLYHATGGNFSRFASREADLLMMQAHFDPRGLLEAIERERLTHLVMVPTMFVRMLKLPEDVRRRYDVSSLQWVLHTGAPCPVEIKRAMIDWFGPVITEVYGSTEAGPVSFVTSPEWLAHPGSVGKALPDTVVKVLDALRGECAPGEIGEICARNANVPNFSYLNLPDARAALDRSGLIATGDLGYFDSEGYLYLSDRRTDLVISGGVNIYPAEIERVLIGMPGILDCAVFGVLDEEYGQSLVAVVALVNQDSITPRAVRSFLADRLANYKIPRRILFDSDLPREESGKIAKGKLPARYRDWVEPSSAQS